MILFVYTSNDSLKLEIELSFLSSSVGTVGLHLTGEKFNVGFHFSHC